MILRVGYKFSVEQACLPPSSDDVEAMAVAKAVPFEVVIKALKSDDSSLASFGTLISFAKLYMDAFVSIFFFSYSKVR